MWKDGDTCDVTLKSNFLKKTMPDMEENYHIKSMIDGLFDNNGEKVNNRRHYKYSIKKPSWGTFLDLLL